MAHVSPPRVLLALSTALVDRRLEIGAFLERFGFQVAIAEAGTESLAACGRTQFDAVVYDLTLTDELGLDVWLGKLKLISPLTTAVGLGSYEQLEILRRASLQADGDYVLFPLSLVELKTRLKRLVVERRETSAAEPGRALEDKRSVDDLVGRSAAMQAIRERIRKIAGLTSTVLITGESGVGKELIARAIHRASPRRDRPFIAINCSALPETLLESELFGHERGAFTGAATLGKGKFELAHQGTLFLDEIGDMNPYTQAKILRVLEEKEFMRVGGSRNIQVDVRLLAATNADLNRRMADGRFREDLYYRLRVLTIEVPPLRIRTEDVPELVRSFVDRFCRTNGMSPKRVTSDSLRLFERYRWPGNIRELRNTLENLIVTVPGDVIDVPDLPSYLTGEGPPAVAVQPVPAGEPGREDPPQAVRPLQGAGSMEDMERELIRSTLTEVGGNRTRAALKLQIGVRTLQRKIKRYGLEGAA